MISRNEVKYIRSLKQKKYRIREGRFLAEGEKLVRDFIVAGIVPDMIFSTIDMEFGSITAQPITEKEMASISALDSPSPVLAVFPIPQAQRGESLTIIALDGIRDPGNLGTIIRLADWFGIDQILCSQDTVDAFNPKVVQASMGSLARVGIHYLDLEARLMELRSQGYKVLGTFMDGDSIYSEPKWEKTLLVMGNEGQGISATIGSLIDRRVSIPRKGESGPESLNVAMATALFLGEICRPTA